MAEDNITTKWHKWLLNEEDDKTIDDQAEYFLFKFNTASGDEDVTRDKVLDLKVEYGKFDDKHKGELEVDQAMRLLESRHETKTFTELRDLLKSIDKNNNNKLSLLEWLCAFFNKSWDTLMEPDAEVDVEAIKAELVAEAKKKEEEAAKAEVAYQRARGESQAVKEAAIALKAAKLEEEKKLTGVRKANAFFTRIAEESQEDANSDMTIEQQVRHEAQLRKEKKLIKQKEEEARREREEAEAKAALIAEEEMKKAGVAKEKAYEDEKARVAAEEEAKKKKEDDERAASRARLKERMKMFEQN
ncbi:hypothetical protein HOP50_03g26120 [Chloropicon primus]|uniref:EF-hand domain-containing protein n=1 Tax=Chloropicon primus TaxID=1764295 RepID=A0A5B8MI16_9CHLO|nr:hypothetical protein A3770_03p26110 [Chloropicon primus]UPQ99305.1 hypothetical protein HOP50_03g26120 [Chloropicon primus]|eukprot:QDZ20093.1 hypothetical protein A3770_03p26110 [Chloropicon primus]